MGIQRHFMGIYWKNQTCLTGNQEMINHPLWIWRFHEVSMEKNIEQNVKNLAGHVWLPEATFILVGVLFNHHFHIGTRFWGKNTWLLDFDLGLPSQVLQDLVHPWHWIVLVQYISSFFHATFAPRMKPPLAKPRPGRSAACAARQALQPLRRLWLCQAAARYLLCHDGLVRVTELIPVNPSYVYYYNIVVSLYAL